MKHALFAAFFFALFSSKAAAAEPPEDCSTAVQIFESDRKIWVMACATGASAYVFDAKGALVETFSLREGENFFACDELAAGIYFAVVTEKDGSTSSFTLSKSGQI